MTGYWLTWKNKVNGKKQCLKIDLQWIRFQSRRLWLKEICVQSYLWSVELRWELCILRSFKVPRRMVLNGNAGTHFPINLFYDNSAHRIRSHGINIASSIFFWSFSRHTALNSVYLYSVFDKILLEGHQINWESFFILLLSCRLIFSFVRVFVVVQNDVTL